MPFSNLMRWGGLAAVLGGGLLVSADLLNLLAGSSSDTYTGTPVEQISAILFLLGKVLLVPGVIGLYLYQAERTQAQPATRRDHFALVAFLLALVGTTLMVGSDWSEVFLAPILAEAAPAVVEQPPMRLMVGFLINYALESLGWLLFGVAAWQAQVFPRAATLLLIVGPFLPFVGPSWIFVVWNGAVVWLGLVVWQAHRPASAVAPVGV
jgi:hypothetical protein